MDPVVDTEPTRQGEVYRFYSKKVHADPGWVRAGAGRFEQEWSGCRHHNHSRHMYLDKR